MDDKKRFSGWSQIEHYLGMTSKTVLQYGYPVRRLGRVFAYRDELDAHRAMLEQSAQTVKQPVQQSS